MPSFNGHFIENMTGKTVSFDVQPYEGGTGTIESMTPRMIDTVEYLPGRGKCAIRYECYDLAIRVTEGSKNGAFYCGVPVSKAKDTAGQLAYISGIRYGQIERAVNHGETIIIARCG